MECVCYMLSLNDMNAQYSNYNADNVYPKIIQCVKASVKDN